MKKNSKVTQVKRDFTEDYINKQGKNMYGWIVVFDNTDTGINHSMDPNKCRFVEGQEADYDISPLMSTRNPGEVWKHVVKFVTPPDQRFSGGSGNKQYTPRELPKEQQMSIAMQVAYEVAIDFGLATGAEKVSDNSMILTNWLATKGLTGDIQKRACGCLRLAVRMMKIPKYKSWTLRELMGSADKLFEETNPMRFVE